MASLIFDNKRILFASEVNKISTIRFKQGKICSIIFYNSFDFIILNDIYMLLHNSESMLI